MPHPFRRNEVIHTFWKGERQPGVWGAGVLPHPGMVPCFAASTGAPVGSGDAALAAPVATAEASPQRGSRGWGVFFRRGRLLPCLCLQHSARGHTVDLEQLSTSVASGRIPTTPPVSLPPGILAPPASDIGGTLTGFRAVDCPVRLRVDYAFSCLREDDEGWVDGWRSQLSWSASRQATLVSDLYSAREPHPEKQKKSPRHSHEKDLGSDQHSWRPTDKLQTLFLEPWSSTWLNQRAFSRPPYRSLAQYHLLSGGERLRDLQFPR